MGDKSKTLRKENLDEVIKAYDIRGETPTQLDESFFKELGKAYATLLDAERIAVARDFRPDSQKFQSSFMEGAQKAGCDTVDIGDGPTELIYFAAGEYPGEFDGAVIITASHNPAGWNGCKMVKKGAEPLSGDYGLEEIKEIMLSGKYRTPKDSGKLTEKDLMPEYKAKVLSFIDTSKIKPLKVVVDAGNGIGGKVFDYVFRDLPLEGIKMYFEPDGTFPNHVPDPFKEENVQEIKRLTVELQADIGIAIDGDADRVFFIDNKGRRPSGAYTGAVLAQYFLEKNPGEKIIHCPRLEWAIRTEVEKLEGEPIRERVGHSFIKARMRKENAIFSPETSSHYYYRDFYYADSGMVTIAIMLQLLSEGLDFDEKMDYMFKNYPNSGEVNYVVKDKSAVLENIEDNFKNEKTDKLDGIGVELDNWRFNVRPSNTQPLLRLNVEGKTKEDVVKGFHKIENIIGGKRDNIPELPELQ